MADSNISKTSVGTPYSMWSRCFWLRWTELSPVLCVFFLREAQRCERSEDSFKEGKVFQLQEGRSANRVCAWTAPVIRSTRVHKRGRASGAFKRSRVRCSLEGGRSPEGTGVRAETRDSWRATLRRWWGSADGGHCESRPWTRRAPVQNWQCDFAALSVRKKRRTVGHTVEAAAFNHQAPTHTASHEFQFQTCEKQRCSVPLHMVGPWTLLQSM